MPNTTQPHLISEALSLALYYGIDFRMILRENPHALEAARALLQHVADSSHAPKVAEIATKALEALLEIVKRANKP
jgi:hypothetical protein